MRLGARRDGALTAIDADIAARHRLGQPLRRALRAHPAPDRRALPVRQRAREDPRGLHQHRPHGAAARRARPHRDVLHRERDGRSRRPARSRSPRAPHEELRRAVPGLRRGDGEPAVLLQAARPVPGHRGRGGRMGPARRGARHAEPRKPPPGHRDRGVLHRAGRLRAVLRQGRRDRAARRHGRAPGGRRRDRGGTDHDPADDRRRGAGHRSRADPHPPRRHRRHALCAVEPRLAHHQRDGAGGAAGGVTGPPAPVRSGRAAPRGLAARPDRRSAAGSTCAGRRAGAWPSRRRAR